MILDASVALSWFFEDERPTFADEVLESLTHEGAQVIPLWRLEVANALLVAERKGRIDPAYTARILKRVRSLPIEQVEQGAAEDILKLARQFRLSAYDAAYLEVAVRLRTGLATLDAPLARAARKLRALAFGPA